MAKTLQRSVIIVLSLVMVLSAFAIVPVTTAGALADTSDPWIFTVNDGTVYALDGKWVRFEDEDFQLSGSGAFTFNQKPDTTTISQLKYGNTVIADSRPTTTTTRLLSSTVYVTGLGTEDHPYIFTPNMIYYKSGNPAFSSGATVYAGYENLPANTSTDNALVPGDALQAVTRIQIGAENYARFEQHSDTDYLSQADGYIGVKDGKYGIYKSGRFVANSSFNLASNSTLYYLGRNSDNVYKFSETLDDTIRSDFNGTNKVVCTAVWEYNNGTKIEKIKFMTYTPGEVPSDGGLSPARADDAAYSYTFTGWEPAYEPVTDDVTYVATYDATPKEPITLKLDSWIFSTDDGRVYPELAGKCYSYNGSAAVAFTEGGSFSVENNQIKLCGITVADIDTSTAYKTFSNSVYVTGKGTQDDPFVFQANYTYGDETKTKVKDGVSIAIDEAHRVQTDKGVANPGDSFKGMSRIRVGTNNVRFMQKLGYYKASRNLLGVSATSYGYRYSKSRALPFDFVSQNSILYYYEKETTGEQAYQFSETKPPMRYTFNEVDTTIHSAKWVNYNGALLNEGNYYVGVTPAYNGATPTRPFDGNLSYTFTGWSPEPEPIFEDQVYTAQYTSAHKLFAGHSLSLNGDIGVNFFLNVTDDQVAQGITVKFDWFNKNSEYTVKVGDDDKQSVVINGNTFVYYLARCNVAAAEMVYNIHATAYIGGELQDETDDYDVRQYGDTIIKAPDGTFEKQDKLVELAKEMLNYGAKAQKVFNRLPDDPANKNAVGYTMRDVSAETISSDVPDMETGLDALGLKYYAPSVVFLTKNTLRQYYTIENQSAFNGVKNSVTFNDSPVTYKTNGSTIYFEVSDIAASKLDDKQSLKIGTQTYEYSVLDYARRLVEKGTDDQKLLGKAVYLYNQAANAYFEN